MNFLNKNKFIIMLAKKNIQSNKLKSIFTIVSIIISTFLINLLILYMLQTNYENKLSLVGRYQATFMGIDEDSIALIRSNKNIDSLGITFPLRENLIDDYSIFPTYMNEEMINLAHMKFIGEIPREVNEIAIEKNYLDYIGSNADIGDSILLNLANTGSREYRITGFVDNGVNDKNYLCIISNSFLKSIKEPEELTYYTYFRLKDSENINPEILKDKIYGLGEEFEIDKSRISISSYYFNILEQKSSQYFSLIILVGIVIALSCFMVVYGVFYISIVNKVKLYGQYRMLGLTKKQIKKLVNYEAKILVCYSLPMGLVLSSLVAFLINPGGWNLSYTIVSAIFVSFFISGIVLISVRTPMKMASKTSPINAGKYTGEYVLNNKKIKKHKKISVYRLSWIDFIRNKKKNYISIISMSFCGILFLGLASFTNSLNPLDIAKEQFALGEYKIALDKNGINDLSNNPIDNNFIDEIESISGVNKVTVLQSYKANIIIPNSKNMDNTIDGIHESEVDKMTPYVIEGEINYKNMMEENKVVVVGSKILKELYDWDVKVGDMISIRFANREESEQYSVAAIMSNNYRDIHGLFFMPAEKLVEIIGLNCNYEVDVKVFDYSDKEVRLQLESIVDQYSVLKLESLEDELEDIKIQLNQYMIPIYTLLAIIGCFGFINMINTLSSNILARKQELSMMQSVGLSSKQLSCMLYIESNIIISISLVIAVVFGSGVGYLIVNVLKQNGLEVLSYNYPYWYLLFYSLLLIFVQYIITYALIKVFKKESLITRIREPIY